MSHYANILKNANVTYNTIILTTSADQEKTFDVIVYVNGIKAKCLITGNIKCVFKFTIDSTPEVSSVSPTSFTSLNTAFTISGSKFSNDMTQVQVTIGTETCELTASNLTSISCVLPRLNLGAQLINIVVNGTLKSNRDQKLFSIQKNGFFHFTLFESIKGSVDFSIIGFKITTHI